MKKAIKIIIIVIIGITVISLIGGGDDNCYFKSGSSYDKLLIKNVVSESVLKYAKYEGSSSDGYVKELKEIDEKTAEVVVIATLKAKNALGVFKNTEYEVKATLNCDGYKVNEISETK
jgi:hypothetical protein